LDAGLAAATVKDQLLRRVRTPRALKSKDLIFGAGLAIVQPPVWLIAEHRL